MGDLRAYRHAIIHSNLELQNDTKKFQFVAKGSSVALTGSQVNEMLAIIFDDLSEMHKRLTGEDVRLLFKRPLNDKTAGP